MAQNYDEKSISKLEYPVNVRERMGMYVGGIGIDAVMHCIQEILDNSIDEFQSGYAREIHITFDHDNDCVTIQDDGRGIPFGTTSTGRDALHMCMTELHAGGKMDKSSYSMSAGVHGVGLACVTALAARVRVQSLRADKKLVEDYEKGYVVKKSRKIVKNTTGKTGTSMTYWPDRELLGQGAFKVKEFYDKLSILSYLLPGIVIHFSEIRDKYQKRHKLYHPNGLIDYISFLTSKAKIHNSRALFYEGTFPCVVKDKSFEGQYQIAMQWTSNPGESMYSYVNSLHTTSGGEHEKVVRKSLTLQLKSTLQSFFKKSVEVTSEDIREGLTIVISILHPNPSYPEQGKKTLVSTDVQAIEETLKAQLHETFARDKTLAQAVADKISLSARMRVESQKARERVSKKDLEYSTRNLSSIGKFADALSRDRAQCELFIVEGDSAGGSAKQARWDRNYQAVFPLRGKPRNTYRLERPSQVFKNQELGDLVRIIGAGIGESFDMSKMRFARIFIMADADDDGKHIQALLLGFFFKYMPEVILEGRLFCVNPPLYKYTANRTTHFAMNEHEWQAIVKNQIHNVSWKTFGEIRIGACAPDLEERYFLADQAWIEYLYNTWGHNIMRFKRFMEDNRLCWIAMLELGRSMCVEMFLERMRSVYELHTDAKNEYLEGMIGSYFQQLPLDITLLRKIKSDPIFEYLATISHAYRYLPYQPNYDTIHTIDRMIDFITPKSRQRMKGLGESNASDLCKTSMHPDTRNVVQITMHDVVPCVQYFDWCLGDDSDMRKTLMLQNQSKYNINDL